MTSGGKASSLLTEFFLALLPLARSEQRLYSSFGQAPFLIPLAGVQALMLSLQVSSALHLLEGNKEIHLGGVSVVAGRGQSWGMGWGPYEKAQMALET